MKEAIFQALLGGVLIGLASWLLLAALGKIAGVTGIVAAALAPNVSEKTEPTGRAWRWLFVVGLMLGGFVASHAMAVPNQTVRPVWLLVVAGLCVGYGTIVGSGCTSGHGVCGLGRRSMRSLVATLCFMGAGMVTVFCIHALTGKPML